MSPSSEGTSVLKVFRLGILLLLIGVASIGCGEPTVVAFPSGPPLPDDSPAGVVARGTLPWCGFEEVTLAGATSNPEGRSCFWDAYSHQLPAEFVSYQTTVEGDPITFIFRALPGGQAEVFVDQTQDRYSAGGWLRLTCPGLTLSGDPPVLLPGVVGDNPRDCIETSLPTT